MQPLHLEYDDNGDIIPDQRITSRLVLLAQAIVGAAGAVIDMSQNAYRYDEHFVFRLAVTGLTGKTEVSLSSSLEPLEHEDFYLVVEDAVDALEIMEALRAQLRRHSLPLLCQAESVSPAGAARAMAISDVIRWHNAQIAHFTAERERMQQWSKENDGSHPGSLYDDYERSIEHHQHIIARVAEITS